MEELISNAIIDAHVNGARYTRSFAKYKDNRVHSCCGCGVDIRPDEAFFSSHLAPSTKDVCLKCGDMVPQLILLKRQASLKKEAAAGMAAPSLATKVLAAPAPPAPSTVLRRPAVIPSTAPKDKVGQGPNPKVVRANPKHRTPANLTFGPDYDYVDHLTASPHHVSLHPDAAVMPVKIREPFVESITPVAKSEELQLVGIEMTYPATYVYKSASGEIVKKCRPEEASVFGSPVAGAVAGAVAGKITAHDTVASACGSGSDAGPVAGETTTSDIAASVSGLGSGAGAEQTTATTGEKASPSKSVLPVAPGTWDGGPQLSIRHMQQVEVLPPVETALVGSEIVKGTPFQPGTLYKWWSGTMGPIEIVPGLKDQSVDKDTGNVIPGYDASVQYLVQAIADMTCPLDAAFRSWTRQGYGCAINSTAVKDTLNRFLDPETSSVNKL